MVNKFNPTRWSYHSPFKKGQKSTELYLTCTNYDNFTAYESALLVLHGRYALMVGAVVLRIVSKLLLSAWFTWTIECQTFQVKLHTVYLWCSIGSRVSLASSSLAVGVSAAELDNRLVPSIASQTNAVLVTRSSPVSCVQNFSVVMRNIKTGTRDKEVKRIDNWLFGLG